MKWFIQLFRSEAEAGPRTLGTGKEDLEVALYRGREMLTTLLDAYGDDSTITKQQRPYVQSLQRELSAKKEAAA